MNSRLRWRSLTSAWTLPVSRSIPANRLSVCLGPDGQDIRARPPPHARAHGVPAAAWSTAHADSRAPWPCRTPATPTRLGLRRDDRFFARPWSILDGRQRPIGQRPLHAALNRLMVDPNSLPYRTERRILAIGQQHLRPRYPACSLGSRPRKNRQSFNLFVGHRQFDCSPPSLP